MTDMFITVIVRPYHVQIYTHGCHYTCRLKTIAGLECFWFKQHWYPVSAYCDARTRVNPTFEGEQ